MISTLCWVRKGVAKRQPEKVEMDEAEYELLMQKVKEQTMEDVKEEEEKILKKEHKRNGFVEKEDDELAIYNLDTYDEEDDGDTLPIFSRVEGLIYHGSNDEDPYISLKEDVEEDEDIEDTEIRPSDYLILTGRTEDELSHLEVYVYEEHDDNLYVHHDIMLSAFPLCLEWLDFNTNDNKQNVAGNFVAVGTFQTEIEIWDLDVIDGVYPHAILGERKKGERKQEARQQRHLDAVLGLSWNHIHRHILASCSADKSVKLWDLSKLLCLRSFEHHTEKVQSVQWNPSEPTVLVTGAFDHTATAFDTRTPQTQTIFKLTSDVECLRWNPFDTNHFLVSTEDGLVACFDIRKLNGKQSVFTLQAHDKAVCTMNFNMLAKDILVTGSIDKMVKVWDLKNNHPSCLISRDLGVGKVFTAGFCMDSPSLLAVAGGKGKVHVWNIAENEGVRHKLEEKLGWNLPDPIIRQKLASDDESDYENSQMQFEMKPRANEHVKHSSNVEDMDDDDVPKKSKKTKPKYKNTK